MILKLLKIITETFIIRLIINEITIVNIWSYERFINSNNLWNSGAKYVSNKMLRCFHNFSICLGIMSTKKLAKDSAETFVYYIGNGSGIPWLFDEG